jgi:hypothetical protein
MVLYSVHVSCDTYKSALSGNTLMMAEHEPLPRGRCCEGGAPRADDRSSRSPEICNILHEIKINLFNLIKSICYRKNEIHNKVVLTLDLSRQINDHVSSPVQLCSRQSFQSIDPKINQPVRKFIPSKQFK